MAEKTIFEKIAAREIPAQFEYEDDQCFAIRDINPQAPSHLLIVPKTPIKRLDEAENSDEELLGHLLLVARDLAKKHGFNKGYRVVLNSGPDGGESVPHMHVHLLAGRQMTWPPG